MDVEIIKTETNMGKDSIIVDGYSFRKDRELKCAEISWRCTANRQKCKAKLRTDLNAAKIISGDLEHNHISDTRSNKHKVIRAKIKRKANDDITARPSKVICGELKDSGEDHFRPQDIVSIRQALYRERRKKYPKLQKSREEVNVALEACNK